MALFPVIRHDGEPDVFAWKYPDAELRLGTQLIVNEAQEAVLVYEGQALDVFGSGRHTLSTANLPLLGALIRLPFGGRSPFTAELWFINRACKLDISWGTPTPVQIQDAKYGVLVPLRAHGMLGLQVADSRRFLVKLAANQPKFGQEELLLHFRGPIVMAVKDALASYVVQKRIGVLELPARLGELSEYVRPGIQEEMETYGLRLLSFHIDDISVPEEDPAVQALRTALARRAEMELLGYDYREQRTFDVAETAAGNAGASILHAGLGLALGAGLGKSMAERLAELGRTSRAAGGAACPSCGSSVPAGAGFCPACGAPLSRRCPQCGAGLEGSPKFCPECGAKL